MYVCMYVSMHACMHACMYVCMYWWMDWWMDVWMYVCMHVCVYVCMHVCVYVFVYVYVYVHIYIYVYMYIYINIYIYIEIHPATDFWVREISTTVCLLDPLFCCFFITSHQHVSTGFLPAGIGKKAERALSCTLLKNRAGFIVIMHCAQSKGTDCTIYLFLLLSSKEV